MSVCERNTPNLIGINTVYTKKYLGYNLGIYIVVNI